MVADAVIHPTPACLVQLCVDGIALIENEALTVIVCAATLFEILQNAAVQLEDVLESFAHQEWARFFATDSAGAKHHERLIFGHV